MKVIAESRRMHVIRYLRCHTSAGGLSIPEGIITLPVVSVSALTYFIRYKALLPRTLVNLTLLFRPFGCLAPKTFIKLFGFLHF